MQHLAYKGFIFSLPSVSLQSPFSLPLVSLQSLSYPIEQDGLGHTGQYLRQALHELGLGNVLLLKDLVQEATRHHGYIVKVRTPDNISRRRADVPIAQSHVHQRPGALREGGVGKKGERKGACLLKQTDSPIDVEHPLEQVRDVARDPVDNSRATDSLHRRLVG